MILIDAAGKQPRVDQQALDALLEKYDRSGRETREEVAGEIEALVAPAVRGMLGSQLSGLGLGNEEIEALVTESVQRALRESGTTRYRRQDIVPETLVHLMRTTEKGRLLLTLLPKPLQEVLMEARYVKADLAQSLTDTLSDHLLTLPDLASRLGLRPQDVTTSLVERTANNAALLSSLFPDAIKQVSKPNREPVAYIARFLLPAMKKRLLKEKTPGITPQMRADWGRIKYIVEQLRASGHQPTPSEVFEMDRQELERRTGPARTWLEGKIREVQPHNAFPIRSAIDLRAAREILDEAGVDARLWRDPGSPYYLSKRDIKPLGKQNIERLMSTPGLGAPSAQRVLPTAPARQQQGEVPDWTALYRQIGSRERLQSAIIDHLFGEPQHQAERQTALFLTDHPKPNPQEIERFISGLRPDVAEDIRSIGFDRIAYEVDDRIRDLLRSPDAIQEIAAELGLSSGTGYRSAEAIRRQIFVRSVRRTVRIVRAASAPKIRIPEWADNLLDDRGRLYLAVSDLILGRRLGLHAFRSIGQYMAGFQNQSSPSDKQIREFLAALPADEAAKIRALGWSNAVRMTDDLVLAYLGQPEIRRELREMLGLDPEREAAAVGAVRRKIEARSAAGMRRAS